MDRITPIVLPHTRIITISGRIASGSTTLAKHLSRALGWRHVEGGEIFWEAVRAKLGLSPKDTHLRPDAEDADFDASLKKVLAVGEQIVLETKLAGFNAQGVDGVFKVLVMCAGKEGNDQTEIRIDRLVNREHMTIHEAKAEVLEREKNDIEKWRRLYAPDDPSWNYWNTQYYDLVVNTYEHDPEEALQITLQAIGYSPKE